MAATEIFSSILLGDPLLKAYYRAEDLLDSSTNGKTLTSSGTVNFAAAKFNNGFSATFSDSTNHLTNTSVYAPGTGEVTIGCWFKRNGAPTTIDFTPTILSLGSADGAIRCTLQATKANGYLESLFYNSSGDTATSTTNVCDNALHLIVMSRIGTAVSIYVDGVAVGSGVTSSKNISTDDLLIGYAGASSGFDYIGAAIIDEVFVLGRGLNANENLALYNGMLNYRLVASASGVAITAGLDTSAANVIFLSTVYDGATSVSDSKGNTWTALTARGAVHKLYYCVNPIVGSAHTFTVSPAYGAIFMQAFKTLTTVAFDTENGATVTGTSLATGSITPSVDGELIISGLTLAGTSTGPTINSSFTSTNPINAVTGVSYGGGIAWKIQTSGAINPTWSWTNSAANADSIAAFKLLSATVPSRNLMKFQAVNRASTY